ncbi:MAG: cytochrome c3 family protein [Planctomycetota bacterium]
MGLAIFPKWVNKVRFILAGAMLGGPLYAVVLFGYGASPETLNVGYMPTQPVPYSHKLHAGDLNIDCRYCHTTVETAAFAAIPPTATCMNCHTGIKGKNQIARKIRLIEESYETGNSIEWIKVHDLPDYVYFNHSAHVLKGVGCETCHGRVDTMVEVYQAKPLSMGWCVDCHRNPEAHIRPLDQVTKMGWEVSDAQLALNRQMIADKHINPSTDCSTCHR